MKFTTLIFVLLFFSAAKSQSTNTFNETEKLINLILSDKPNPKVIYNWPATITLHEFEEYNYQEHTYPQKPRITKSIDNIDLEYPIEHVLEKLGEENFQYYTNQIKSLEHITWKKKKLQLDFKPRFVSHRWILHKKAHFISTPIFNDKKNIAIVKYYARSNKFKYFETPRIFIFIKNETKWEVYDTIYPIKY